MKLLVLSMVIVFALTADVSAQGWRGIVPLRSTRADVERLLGRPERACACEASAHGMCSCSYAIPEGFVSVDYSVSPCVGYPSGWNVPADTVLRLRIRWEEPRAFSEAQVDVREFEKALDDTLTTYYASREKGVQYTVSSENKLGTTTYFPTLKDAHLRCPCAPVLDDSTQRSIYFDVFEFRSVDENVLARLDNYVIAVSDRDALKGYVMLYRGKLTSAKAALRHRQAVAKHIYRTRGFSEKQIVIIDAGYRDRPSLELFMIFGDLAPPEPRATWRPCKQRSRKAG